MKNELKISRMSIVCVLCAAAMSGAYGASTVRTLGGSGTYSSAASASAAGSTTGVARASTVRVTPTAAKTTGVSKTTSSIAPTTSGRAAAAPRLSLGKYLGPKTVVSGGTTGGATGGTNPGLADADIKNLQDQIDAASAQLTNALAAVDALQATVNGIVVQGVADGGYISVDKDGMAYLDVEALGANSTATISDDGKTLTITIGENGTPFSVDLPDLLSSSDMNTVLTEKLENYVTKNEFTEFKTEYTELKTIVDALDADSVTGDELDDALAGKADKLTDGFTAGNVATIGADGQYIDGGVLLNDLATQSDVTALSNKIGTLPEGETVETVVNRVEQLKTEINNNMSELVEQNLENLTFIEKTEQGDFIIKENSITAREIAPNSITGAEIKAGTIAESNLSTDVTKQLIGTPDAAAVADSGLAVILVDADGNKIWTPLEMADAEESATGGTN